MGNQQPKYLKLMARDLRINHSDVIIQMLTKAYDHYFKRNLKRMIYYIANCIAEEHYASGQWERAKMYFLL